MHTTERPPFSDGKITASEERLRLFRLLASQNPSLRVGMAVLRQGGSRGDKGSSIEGDGIIDSRSFDNIAEHNAVVALVTHELGQLVGLDKNDLDTVVTGSFIHDASKRTEISLLSYRKLLKKPNLSPTERLAAENIIGQNLVMLRVEDIISVDSITNTASGTLPDYLSLIDTINHTFLSRKLKKSALAEVKQQQLVELGRADNFAHLDTLLVRVRRLLGQDATDDASRSFLKYVDSLPSLPTVTADGLDLQAAILWCSDYMVTGTTIEPTTDTRIDALVKKGEYDEVDQQWKEKTAKDQTYFEAVRLTVQAIELFIRQKAAAQGLLPTDENKSLPAIVLERLQHQSLSG